MTHDVAERAAEHRLRGELCDVDDVKMSDDSERPRVNHYRPAKRLRCLERASYLRLRVVEVVIEIAYTKPRTSRRRCVFATII